MIRVPAIALAALVALAACGQKGDLRLPAAKQQPGTQPVAPAAPQPPASTPAPASHK